MSKYKVFNAFWLKIAMLLLMLADHLYYYLYPDKLILWHYAARVVAPVFAFLLAEAMVYTRDRRRYVMRLYLAGIIMELGNALMYYVTEIWPPNNIFLSLAVGASLIYCIDKIRSGESKPLWLALSALLVIASMFCEGQYMVPMMAIIFYCLRGSRLKMYAVYAAASGTPFLLDYAARGILSPQFFMVLAVFPIALYNGRRGSNSAFAKYLFYVFYPVHIWAIVLVRWISS